jgi:ABC-type transport system involved in cytochrome c biogenesis permease subunit
LGWGSPVVWDDPVITTAMATWLYYGLFLHLHLMMAFKAKKNRPVFALIGAVWVFLFNCLPDMGTFMLPRF